MLINDRIELIIRHFNLNKNSFSIKIGVNPTIIHNIIKGRNNPSYEVLSKILHTFDNISAKWLILGEGEMLYSENDSNVDDDKDEYLMSNSHQKAYIKLLEKQVERLERQIDSLNSTLEKMSTWPEDLIKVLEKATKEPRK